MWQLFDYEENSDASVSCTVEEYGVIKSAMDKMPELVSNIEFNNGAAIAHDWRPCRGSDMGKDRLIKYIELLRKYHKYVSDEYTDGLIYGKFRSTPKGNIGYNKMLGEVLKEYTRKLRIDEHNEIVINHVLRVLDGEDLLSKRQVYVYMQRGYDRLNLAVDKKTNEFRLIKQNTGEYGMAEVEISYVMVNDVDCALSCNNYLGMLLNDCSELSKMGYNTEIMMSAYLPMFWLLREYDTYNNDVYKYSDREYANTQKTIVSMVIKSYAKMFSMLKS